MEQGKLSDEYYCYECLSRIDDSMEYMVVTPELLEESGDVLCSVCYSPELLLKLQEES
jgi:hypothetical protein